MSFRQELMAGMGGTGDGAYIQGTPGGACRPRFAGTPMGERRCG